MPGTESTLTAETIATQVRWLRVLTRSLVAHEDRADEVLQETCLAALRHQGQPVFAVRTWLGRIASNLANGVPGRERRRQAIESRRDPVPDEDATVDVVVRAEIQHEVSRAILTLEEPYRSTILLRFMEERSCPEIALALGVPVETVRTRIKRGLAILRGRLDRKFGSTRGWAAPLLGVSSFQLCLLTVMSMSKGLMVAAAIVLGIAASLFFWSENAKVSVAPHAPSTEVDELAMQRAVPKTDESRSVAPRASTSEGSQASTLEVTIHYADGSAAEDIGLWLRPQGDRTSVFPISLPSTDKAGNSTSTSLAPGRYTLFTNRGSWHRAEIFAGNPTKLSVRLPASEVRGVVVNEVGSPIAGADIVLRPEYVNRGRKVTETGADGHFSIRGVKGGRLGAVASGYAPSVGHGCPSSNGSVNMRIVLDKPGGSIRGTVTDAAGAPVDALVRLGSEMQSRVYGSLADGSPASPPPPVDTRTGPDGTFAIDHAAPGKTPVAVRAPGFAPWSGSCEITALDNDAIEIRLEKGVSCAGTVVDANGNPMLGVTVASGDHPTLSLSQTKTDALGRFRLDELRTGRVSLWAWHENGHAERMFQAVAGEELQWQIMFARRPTLRGRVITEAGQPAAKIHIRVSTVAGKMHQRVHEHAIETDAEGRFQLPDCPEAAHIGMLPGQGYSDARLWVKDTTRKDIVLRVRKLGGKSGLRGFIVDAAGKPVPDATIKWSTTTVNASSYTTRLEPTGEFDLRELPATALRLFITAPGLATRIIEAPTLADGENRNLGRLTMTRGGRAKIQLASQSRATESLDWSKVAMTWVRADEELFLGGMMPTGHECFVGQLAPGHYVLHVYGSEIAAIARRFEITEARDTVIHVPLCDGAPCRLEILGATRARISIEGPKGLVHDQWTRQGEKLSLVPGQHVCHARTEAGKTARIKFTMGDKPRDLEVDLR